MIKDGTYRKFFKFELYEYAAIEAFLSDMAMDGWMVESMVKRRGRGAVFTFHKIEPKKINFTVDICDKSSINETYRSESTLEYIDYCQEAGWNLVCSLGKIQVFYPKDEKSLPIHTDNDLKLKIINKGMFPWFLYNLLFIFMFFATFAYLYLTDRDFSFLTTNYSMLLWFLQLINFTSLFVINILDYGFWYFKSKYRIKKGKTIISNNNKRYFHLLSTTWIIGEICLLLSIYSYSLANNFITSKIGLISILIPLILVIIYIYLSYFRNRRNLKSTSLIFRKSYIYLLYRFSTVTICIILLIYSQFQLSNLDQSTLYGNANIPITIADLNTEISTTSENLTSRAKIDETFLAKHCWYYSSDKVTSSGIAYYIFRSPYKFIVNNYLGIAINYDSHLKYTEVDPTPWEANSVYISYINDREVILVAYDNKVLQFFSDSSLNKENIELIRDKLDLNN